jgi:hypothetical protein
LFPGCFYGLARHSSGAEISILYNVKRIVLKSGDIRYCVWITRDSEDTAGKTQVSFTLSQKSVGAEQHVY